MKPIAVIQQVDHAGPGHIATVFDGAGVPWRLCRAGDGEPLPALNQVSGLIVLGGPMSANDALPFLQAEIALLRQAAETQVPVLGLCLGAQLLARSLDATVRPNPTKEIGWLPIWPTVHAAGDPLLGAMPQASQVPHWHGETFDLPNHAVHLAYSERCAHQAFRYGERLYGLQFHPEVTPEILATWIEMDAACGPRREASHPIDPLEHISSSAALATQIFRAFAHLARQSH